MASTLKDVIVGEGSSGLCILSSVPPLFLFDMLLVTRRV